MIQDLIMVFEGKGADVSTSQLATVGSVSEMEIFEWYAA